MKVLKNFLYFLFPMMGVLIMPGIKYAFTRSMIISIGMSDALAVTYYINSYLITINGFFISLISSSETLISRFNGAKDFQKITRTTWQGIWAACFFSTIFLTIVLLRPQTFIPTNMYSEQSVAYCILIQISFAIYHFQAAFIGFFIGIKKLRIILFNTFLNAIVHILMCLTLIKDNMSQVALPSLISNVTSVIFLGIIFFFYTRKEKFHTENKKVDFKIMNDCFQLAWPTSLNHFIESFAWLTIVSTLNKFGNIFVLNQEFTTYLYRITSFLQTCMERTTKNMSAKYMGEGEKQLSLKVVKTGIGIHIFYSTIFLLVGILFRKEIVSCLSVSNTQEIMEKSFVYFLITYSVEGISWIIIGFLTAAKDNKFILCAHMAAILTIFVLPTTLYYNFVENASVHLWMKIYMFHVSVIFILVTLRYYYKHIKSDRIA